MLDIKQLTTFVIDPTLRHISLWSPAAERLTIVTGAQESGNFFWIDQLATGPGPGRGFYQMEKLTHDDMWERVIPAKPGLLVAMNSLTAPWPSKLDQLHTNLAYATAMCRIKYYSIKDPLPNEDDMHGMALYWKKYYNTEGGKGTIPEFEAKWKAIYGAKK